jgi:glyoxylase-like metal-dependent hydrolase (beta-lactamase superfamily II)
MTVPFDRGRWADAAAETVRPGVHRVPLPLPNDGLRAVNVYVLEAADGLVMIDGGWAIPEARKALETALAGLGRDLGEVRHILVTHIHRDHYTQAVELRRLVGAQVYLGAGERRGLELVHSHSDGAPSGALANLRRNGGRELAERIQARMPRDVDLSQWEAPDRWLGAETLTFGDLSLRVIPTPGHTRGHVVYLDEAHGELYAGDHVLPHITPSIGFELADPGLPLGDYLASLRLMTSLSDARLLPAHGPLAPSVHARADELLAHHDDRLAHTLDALGDEARSAYAVAERLLWTRRGTAFADLNSFNQMLAVNETVAHLDVLVDRGQAERVDADGEVRYRAVQPPSA